MKRFLAMLLAALMLPALLTGCGGTGAPTPAAGADSGSDSSGGIAATVTPEPTAPPLPIEEDGEADSSFTCSDVGEISGYTGSETDILIPASIGASTITGVGSGVFKGNGAITSVTVSEGVVCIADEAFRDCTSLRTVVLPGSLTRIDNRAFAGCTALESVSFGGGLIEIGSCAFEGCQSLKEIDLTGVETMGDGAFSETGLVNIVIPGSLKIVPENAFDFCQDVQSITFSEGVEEIMPYAFCFCGRRGKTTDTYNFLTDEDVQNYRNVVHANDPGYEKFFEITLPSTIRRVHENAFLGVRLEGLYLPWLTDLRQLPAEFMPCFEHYECIYVSQEALDACGVDSLNAFFSMDDCFDYWGGSVRIFDGRRHYWTDEELGLDA